MAGEARWARPPDFSVGAPRGPEEDARLRAAVSAGSPDALFALGLRSLTDGRLDEAAERWGRAAKRGSAEARLGLAAIHLLRGDASAYETAVSRADQSGSMLAAGEVARLEAHQGHRQLALAARQRLVHRARQRDAEGSADAALVLVSIAGEDNDLAAATAAFARAEERGAPQGSVGLAQALMLAGDTEAALAPAKRAEAAGLAVGSYLRALLHKQRGEHQQAWDAIHRAVLTAAETGDDETLQAAKLSLRPYGLAWWRQHRHGGLVLIALLAAVAMLEPRWALALLALLLAFAASQRPIVPGLPLQLPEASNETVSIMGVSIGGSFEHVDDDLRPASPEPRMATTRDHSFWRACVTVFALASLALLPWAVGLIDNTGILRVGAGALAVLIGIVTVWQWPHTGASTKLVERDDLRPAFTVNISVAPTLFTQSYLRLSITNPWLEEMVRRRARRREQRGPLATTVRRLIGQVPAVTAVAFFATFALAPNQKDAVVDLIGLWVTGMEVLILTAGIVLVPRRVWAAARHREWGELLGVAGFVLAAALAIGLAHTLGWTGPILHAILG